MIYLAFITATLIATQPPKIVKMFADEASCLKFAAELNSYPEMTSRAAIDAGDRFICLKALSIAGAAA